MSPVASRFAQHLQEVALARPDLDDVATAEVVTIDEPGHEVSCVLLEHG